MFPVIRRKKMLLGGWSETQEQRRNDRRVAFSGPYQDQYITRSVDQATVRLLPTLAGSLRQLWGAPLAGRRVKDPMRTQ